MTGPRVWAFAVMALAGLGRSEAGTAQPAPRPGAIRGLVIISRERKPVQGARVKLVGTEYRLVTDARGGFHFGSVPPGKYTIEAAAIGFGTLVSPIVVKPDETLDLEFEVESEAVTLPEVSVEAVNTNGPADWLRRRTEGRGRYYTRGDIERHNSQTIPDLLSSLAGVRVECGTGFVCRYRFARARIGCGPAFFMDGVPADPAVGWLTPIEDIEGIEVYSGPAETPPELESNKSACGVIVLWTRTPPPRRPKQKKPKNPPPDSLQTKPDSVKSGELR